MINNLLEEIKTSKGGEKEDIEVDAKLKNAYYVIYERFVNFRNMKFIITPEFEDVTKKVLSWFAFDFMQSRWLLLSGGVGTGKTVASKVIAALFLQQNKNVIQKNAVDISLLYNDINKKQRACDEYESFINCDVLIIDDLGTEYKPESLNEILYKRYNNLSLTIFTTNLDFDELNQYGARIFDRFLELGTVIKFNGGSFRKLNRQHNDD